MTFHTHVEVVENKLRVDTFAFPAAGPMRVRRLLPDEVPVPFVSL